MLFWQAKPVFQLKREIGKLWEDITRAPYKELFNPSVNSFFLWRAVQTQRLIDKAIDQMSSSDELTGRDLSVAVHGNRMISAVVFQALPLQNFGSPSFDFDDSISQLKIFEIVRGAYNKLKAALDESYPNAIIPTLFKNLSKCTDLYTKIK